MTSWYREKADEVLKMSYVVPTLSRTRKVVSPLDTTSLFLLRCFKLHAFGAQITTVLVIPHGRGGEPENEATWVHKPECVAVFICDTFTF